MPEGINTDDQVDEAGGSRGIALRQLPRNVAAEQGLLGAIFVDNRAYERISDVLRPEHFYLPAHQRIFEAVVKVIERGQIADPTTLRPYFEADDSLSEIGGAAYLANLTANAVSVINAKEYGRIVYDSFLKRELIAIGEDVVNEAFEADLDSAAPAQIEKAEARLYELATTGQVEGGFQDFRAAMVRAIEMAEIAHKRDGSLAGVGSGFRDLDKLLGGLHPSDLIVLAGRPAMGKTALATNIAFHAADAWTRSNGDQGGIVGFFSLEMSAEQLAARILAEQSNISSDRMRKGELSNDEFNRLFQASTRLNEIPLFIDDTPALTVSALRTRARRLKRQHGLGLIVVDYLQLIQGQLASRSDGRVQEVSEITRGLKTLAKELDVPVVALSQLSRKVEDRPNKRPQLADLRESGSIEQDADVVLFIYREAYYLERDKPQQRVDQLDAKYADALDRWERKLEEKEGVAEVIVAKQRHGPIGDVELSFQGEFTRFGDLDRVHGGQMTF